MISILINVDGCLSDGSDQTKLDDNNNNNTHCYYYLIGDFHITDQKKCRWSLSAKQETGQLNQTASALVTRWQKQPTMIYGPVLLRAWWSDSDRNLLNVPAYVEMSDVVRLLEWSEQEIGQVVKYRYKQPPVW